MASLQESNSDLNFESEFEGELAWDFEDSFLPKHEPGEWRGNIHGGSGSKADRQYQRQITGKPTSQDYHVQRGKLAADFDGYRNGVLLDAKNLSGNGFVVRMWKWMHEKNAWPPEMLQRWAKAQLAEARRQLKVAGKTPVAWHVSSADGQRVMKQLLGANGLLQDRNRRGIQLVLTPQMQPKR
jgi:hypothetical protein